MAARCRLWSSSAVLSPPLPAAAAAVSPFRRFGDLEFGRRRSSLSVRPEGQRRLHRSIAGVSLTTTHEGLGNGPLATEVLGMAPHGAAAVTVAAYSWLPLRRFALKCPPFVML